MDGQRVEQAPRGKKKGLIVAGIVAAVILCAYLGLCIWVGTLDTIFPRVTVNGLDLSGMTAQQGQGALDQAMADQGEEIVATLTYGGWRGSLTAAQMEYDWSATVQEAWSVGRGNFITQGGQYLARLLGMSSAIAGPRSGQPAALTDLLDRVETEVVGDVTSADYRVNGETLVMTKGVTGVSIPRDEVRTALLDAMDEAMERKLGQGSQGTAEATRALTPEETPPQEPDYQAIHQALYAQVEDAHMDPETYTITEHVVGVDFDVDALRAAYEAAGEGTTFTLPLTVTQPKETRESLEAKLFKDLLGEGTTRVTGSSNRKSNVKLSAEACNNVILLPGEEFSYNNTTGSRSEDKGYLNAPIYRGGESVDDIGGGICQTSSTIYYAVLHTNLEVVERHDHQFNTGYVTEGMDATVFFGSLDFRFKNSTEYPVKIVTESYDRNGSRYLNVKLYGTNEEGIYAVPESTVYDIITPTNKYVADSSVPQGTLVLDSKQNAYTGKSAQTTRYIYDKDGNLLESQDMGKSKYSMRPNLYHYNPLDGDPASWPNGTPPQPTPAVPETPVQPETGGATEPGTTTTPEQPADPGVTTDPGTTTDPSVTPEGEGGSQAAPEEGQTGTSAPTAT